MNERNLTQVEALSIAANLKNSNNIEPPLTESEQKRIERLQKICSESRRIPKSNATSNPAWRF